MNLFIRKLLKAEFVELSKYFSTRNFLSQTVKIYIVILFLKKNDNSNLVSEKTRALS